MARGYAASFHPFTPDTMHDLLRYVADSLGQRWAVVAWDEPSAGDEFLVLLKKAC
jgi:hypothetical protein